MLDYVTQFGFESLEQSAKYVEEESKLQKQKRNQAVKDMFKRSDIVYKMNNTRNPKIDKSEMTKIYIKLNKQGQ